MTPIRNLFIKCLDFRLQVKAVLTILSLTPSDAALWLLSQATECIWSRRPLAALQTFLTASPLSV